MYEYPYAVKVSLTKRNARRYISQMNLNPANDTDPNTITKVRSILTDYAETVIDRPNRGVIAINRSSLNPIGSTINAHVFFCTEVFDLPEEHWWLPEVIAATIRKFNEQATITAPGTGNAQLMLHAVLHAIALIETGSNHLECVCEGNYMEKVATALVGNGDVHAGVSYPSEVDWHHPLTLVTLANRNHRLRDTA